MRVAPVLVLATSLAASACGGGSPTSPSTSGASFNVMLKDSPFTDAKALLVSFSDVSVHKSTDADGQWTKVAFASGATSRTCDLKKLQTAQDVLGTGSLAAGHYTQVRLTVSAATVYFDNPSAGGAACAATIAAPAGANASVDVPSGEVKLNREFDVSSSGATMMVLDFDGDQSVHQTGNGRYTMSPVISVVSVGASQ